MFSASGGALLFHLLSTQYERSSVAIITNLSFSEWVGICGDAKMTAAPLDRLTHHCHILETGNYRFHFNASKKPSNAREIGSDLTSSCSRAKPPLKVGHFSAQINTPHLAACRT